MQQKGRLPVANKHIRMTIKVVDIIARMRPKMRITTRIMDIIA
jgi:hypothetical protein